jgi:hypothetical protein
LRSKRVIGKVELENRYPQKEAIQSSDAELDEAKHGQELQLKADETPGVMLLISQPAGALANGRRIGP